jgi:F420-dependent oxidoreductase-like protein
MIDVSVMIEGQMGLTWPRWRALVAESEACGFAGLFRSDHFVGPRPPNEDALEALVSLTYVADHTQRIHFGPLVAPLSFRDPMHLVRQAAAIDDLSGGRFILGLGSGWQEREHTMFGYALGDIPTRMARFEEGLEVITRLLHSDTPVTYEGRFFQLRDAILLPRPARPGSPPILIGGNGPKRTLPLAARYANIWNGLSLSPDGFREHSATLDGLLDAAGRPRATVKRTLMTLVFFGEDRAALTARLAGTRRFSPAAPVDEPLDAQIAFWRGRNAIVGSAEECAEQIRAYAAAGVQEFMCQWLDMDDIAGLRAFGEGVLPRLQ